MRTGSTYEGSLNRTGMVCLGRVVSIDAGARTVRAKTMGMPGSDDLDLGSVRVLHGVWHSDGDEDVMLPRINTYGIILFLGPEAIWLGSVQFDATSGESQRQNMEKLNPGDRVIKTVYGNKLIIRTGGTIEIQSTDLCRTFWIPNQNLISSTCQNFELETSGGNLKWKIDAKDATTNLHLSAWNSLTPDTICTLDIGTIPDDNNESDSGSSSIAAYDAADLFFDFKIGSIDEDLNIDQRGLRFSVKNDGSVFFDIGPGNFSMTVDASTGDVQFQTAGEVKGEVKKDVTLDVTGDVNLTSKGEVSVEASKAIKLKNESGGEMHIDSSGKIAFGNQTAELLDLINQLLTALMSHNHGTGVGPSSPPILGAPEMTQIQTLLGQIKGSL